MTNEMINEKAIRLTVEQLDTTVGGAVRKHHKPNSNVKLVRNRLCPKCGVVPVGAIYRYVTGYTICMPVYLCGNCGSSWLSEQYPQGTEIPYKMLNWQDDGTLYFIN